MMEYLVQRRGDTYIVTLTKMQVRLLDWLYQEGLLSDDVEWNALEDLEMVDLITSDDD